MHAIMITFESHVGLEALREPSGSLFQFDNYVTNLRDRSGFISKTWLRNGATFGGFYLFADKAAAERYLDEVMAPLGRANPSLAHVQVHHFDVDEDASAVTRGLPTATVVG
jgi:hypothetical protein